jgi:hypothetical protein
VKARPNASDTPSADWLRLVRQSWPAVVASDLLDLASPVWAGEGLSPPSPEEAVVLATAGRLVRYGQSVCTFLPISAEPVLPRLAFYLHRLRLDATAGLIRSSWLNPSTMKARSDLLVFGRTRTLMRDFSTSITMRPIVLQTHRPLEKANSHRTLLVSGQGDVFATLEALQENATPFAIIVNLTQQGCNTDGISLVRVLREMFPSVPLVVIGQTGQTFSDLPSMHVWEMRSADVERARHLDYTPIATDKPVFELFVPSDPFFDQSISKLSMMNWNLKKKLAETSGVGKETEALLKIERTFRSLNVPLSVHEYATVRHIRGGRYPVRMVASWMDIAKRLTGRRGDIQELHDQVISFLNRFVETLLAAKRTGRTQLLEQLCAEAIEEKKHVSILVENAREAEILQTYLEATIGQAASEYVVSRAMDGSSTKAPASVDWVIYACPLFPSRTPWLGLPSSRHIVLCYPYEKERVAETLRHWWMQHARASEATGDKYRLWAFDWGKNEFLTDRQPAGNDAEYIPVVITEKALDGEYPKQARIVTIATSHRHDDWLNALMTDPVLGNQDDDENFLPGSENQIVVHLQGESDPVRWPANRQILRLTANDVEVCRATDLIPEDDLILLRDTDDRVTTQRELFEMFVNEDHGLAQTLRLAEKWQQLVDGGIAKFDGPSKLNRYLRSKGHSVDDTTVSNWGNGGVIGPRDTQVIATLAEVLEYQEASKLASMVMNAIKTIRAEHQRIGVDLRRAIMASRRSGIGMVQIGSRRFAREVFDGMVQICRVTTIQRPPIQHQPRRTIGDVAAEFAETHKGKLLFTSACRRSIAASVFTDLLAFRGILMVLADGFYPMYATKSVSLKEVEDRLATIPASYAGGMSDTTKGKHEQDYYRLYEGKQVDISPHIKLGRVHDPKYTLRLHFHWDAQRALIVVHHAGVHLPTRRN